MSGNVEPGLFTRRSFLRWSQSALALIGAAPIVGAASPSEAFALHAPSNSADDYYSKLGVEKIINAAGTYTYLTAALMPPQVQRAVAQAALHPVRLKDLQQASGEYIAKNTSLRGSRGHVRSLRCAHPRYCRLHCIGKWL
jgi:L-seryl-tRNA(Ser) seleniumtransferase